MGQQNGHCLMVTDSSANHRVKGQTSPVSLSPGPRGLCAAELREKGVTQ